MSPSTRTHRGRDWRICRRCGTCWLQHPGPPVVRSNRCWASASHSCLPQLWQQQLFCLIVEKELVYNVFYSCFSFLHKHQSKSQCLVQVISSLTINRWLISFNATGCPIANLPNPVSMKEFRRAVERSCPPPFFFFPLTPDTWKG